MVKSFPAAFCFRVPDSGFIFWGSGLAGSGSLPKLEVPFEGPYGKVYRYLGFGASNCGSPHFEKLPRDPAKTPAPMSPMSYGASVG